MTLSFMSDLAGTVPRPPSEHVDSFREPTDTICMNDHIGSPVESLFEETGDLEAVKALASTKIAQEHMRRLLQRLTKTEQEATRDAIQLSLCNITATGNMTAANDAKIGPSERSQTYENVRALRLAAEGLATRFGVSLKSEIAKHRSRDTGAVHDDEIGELWGIHMKILSDTARQLAYRFLSLPMPKRIEIAQQIGIPMERDDNDRECSRRMFHYARENVLFSRLWEQIERAHGGDVTVTNPYAGR